MYLTLQLLQIMFMLPKLQGSDETIRAIASGSRFKSLFYFLHILKSKPLPHLCFVDKGSDFVTVIVV